MEDSEREKIPFIDEESRIRSEIVDIGSDLVGWNLPLAEAQRPQQQRLFQDSSLYPVSPRNEIPLLSDNVCKKGKIQEISVTEVDAAIPGTTKEFKNGNDGANMELMTIGPRGHERRTSSFKFQIHAAAEAGEIKELERLLLLKGDPLQTDFKKRTPLHYACAFPYQRKAIKMVDIILNCKLVGDEAMNLINFQDNHGETALHIAARTGHRKLTEKLIFAAADVNIKDENGLEPLNLIYSKVPGAMIPVFDGALECKVGDPNDQNLILQFDFGSIVGYPDPKKNAGMFDLETKLLSYCLQQSEQKRSAILLHPVVQVFLHLKWKKVRILLWISILYHVIWLLLYTLFITELYLRQCPYKAHKLEDTEAVAENPVEADLSSVIVNESGTTMSSTWSTDDIGNLEFNETVNATSIGNETEVGTVCEIGRDFLSTLNIELGFLFYVTISVVLKEMYEMYSTPQLKFYFYQLENVGQWILISVVVLTSIPVFFEDDDNIIVIKSWQYQAASLGIFLAWSLILSQIGKIPKFAIYIEILGKVLKSFSMFMITFASLLVAFLVSFQILMPDKTEFSNFPWSFIKVLVMMAGEINYDDIFFDEDSVQDIPFPLSTRLLYAAFVAVVTIILFNLLIGLTVSDIQGLESVALLSNLSSQLEQIYLMEKFIISKKFQRWLIRFKKNHWLRYFLVTQQTDDYETNMGVAIHISKIPRDLQHRVRELAAPNQEDDDEVDQQKDKESVASNPNNSHSPPIAAGVDEADLRRIIKEVLTEVLFEMKISKIPSQSHVDS